MKKLISSVLIAAIVSTSLTGCSSKKPENVSVFGQNTYDEKPFKIPSGNNIKVTNNGSRGLDTIYVISNKDGSETKVTNNNFTKYSTIEKTSKQYKDYTSCIADYNIEVKEINKLVENADKSRTEPDEDINSNIKTQTTIQNIFPFFYYFLLIQKSSGLLKI